MPNSASRRTTGGSQSAFLLSMIFALLVFLSAGRTAAIAQDTQEQAIASGHHMGGRRGMPSADDQLKHLSKMLNLSDDQQAKLSRFWKTRACSMTTSRKSSIRCAKNSAAICATA